MGKTTAAISKAQRKSAARLRNSLESFRMGSFGHLFFLILSVAGGLALYSGLVSVFYGNLYDACLKADPLTDAFDAIPAAGWRGGNQIDDAQIFALLEYFQLLADEELSPGALKAPGAPNNRVYQSLLSLKRSEMKGGSGLAWRLARANSVLDPATKNQVVSEKTQLSCNDKVALCEQYYDGRIAAAIAQLPSPGGVAGKNLQLGGGGGSMADRVSADGLDSFFVAGDARDRGGYSKVVSAFFKRNIEQGLFLPTRAAFSRGESGRDRLCHCRLVAAAFRFGHRVDKTRTEKESREVSVGASRQDKKRGGCARIPCLG